MFVHSNKNSAIVLDLNDKTLTVDENDGISANEHRRYRNPKRNDQSQDDRCEKHYFWQAILGLSRLDEGLTVNAEGSMHTLMAAERS